MKKHLAIIFAIAGLGVFAWAQASKNTYDSKKSQTEMEIMKGILSTTISRSAQNSKKDSAHLDASEITAYYLVGQGAVFTISTSSFRHWDEEGFGDVDWAGFPANVDVNLEGMDEWIQESQEFMRESERIRFESEKIAAEAAKQAERSGVTAPPAPPLPPAPPTPRVSTKINKEELQKRAQQAQERLKKSREAAAARRGKFIQRLEELHRPLIEALANYGDSLATVKPDEYINFILLTNRSGNEEARHDIISAQKSWITDYKAGKMTMEAFKQKVLQYTE